MVASREPEWKESTDLLQKWQNISNASISSDQSTRRQWGRILRAAHGNDDKLIECARETTNEPVCEPDFHRKNLNEWVAAGCRCTRCTPETRTMCDSLKYFRFQLFGVHCTRSAFISVNRYANGMFGFRVPDFILLHFDSARSFLVLNLRHNEKCARHITQKYSLAVHHHEAGRLPKMTDN